MMLRVLSIVVLVSASMSGSASAQECFLFFCPPPAARPEMRAPAQPMPREPLVIAPGEERSYGGRPYGEPSYGAPSYGERPYVERPYGERPYGQSRDDRPQTGDTEFGTTAAARMYAAVRGDRFPIPAVDVSQIDPQYLRRVVRYSGNEAPGTIVIDPHNRFLYFVLGNGSAIRYGIGVGREGFGWSGQAYIRDKQEWPDWYPPKEMLARQPELRRQVVALQSGLGVPGGPRNPLGPRALYLWQGNKDTLYRIHGTTEPWTVGRNVSSGCFRMLNQDVIDLYNRTPVGTKVVVLPHGRG